MPDISLVSVRNVMPSSTKDLLLRPLGDTIYMMPPYCVTMDLNKIDAGI